MEDYTEIINQVNQLIYRIQTQMRVLETGQTLKAKLEQPDLTIVFRGGEDKITLGDFLYPEQLEGLKQLAVSQVETRMRDAAALLGQMIRRDAEPAKPETAVMSKPASKKEQRKTVDEAEVRRLYLEEGKTMQEIADLLGFTNATIRCFLSRHGIKRQSAKPPEQEGFRGDDKATDDEGGVPAVDDSGARLAGAEMI